jgi:ERCC4-related helicase
MKIEMNPYLRLMRDKVVELIEEYTEIKGMVFVQTRATAFALAQYLSHDLGSLGDGGLRAAPFTGTNSSETTRGKKNERWNVAVDTLILLVQAGIGWNADRS